MDALPIFKRVSAWFPGPSEATETLHQCHRQLNQGLDPRQWRIYECKEKPNGVRLVLSIDQASVTTLERGGRPSAAWDKPTSPFWAPSRRGRNRRDTIPRMELPHLLTFFVLHLSTTKY
jgi:hypothetical protein